MVEETNRRVADFNSEIAETIDHLVAMRQALLRDLAERETNPAYLKAKEWSELGWKATALYDGLLRDDTRWLDVKIFQVPESVFYPSLIYTLSMGKFGNITEWRFQTGLEDETSQLLGTEKEGSAFTVQVVKYLVELTLENRPLPPPIQP